MIVDQKESWRGYVALYYVLWTHALTCSALCCVVDTCNDTFSVVLWTNAVTHSALCSVLWTHSALCCALWTHAVTHSAALCSGLWTHAMTHSALCSVLMDTCSEVNPY